MGMKAKISLLALMIATVAGAIAFDKFHAKTTATPADQVDPQKGVTPVKPIVAERPPSHGGLTPVTRDIAAGPPRPTPPEPPIRVQLPTPPPAEMHPTPPAAPAPPTPTPPFQAQPPQPPQSPNHDAVNPLPSWKPHEEDGTLSFGTKPTPPDPSKPATPPVDERNIVRPPDPLGPMASKPAPTPTPAPPVAPPMPAPTPTPAPAASQAPDSYVIAPGDSFYVIAQKVYGSPRHWKEIAEANKDVFPDAENLVVGKKIRIPKLAAEPPKPPSSVANAPQPVPPELAGKKTHVVKAGDSFSAISKLYYHDSKYWKKIAEANPKKDSSDLRIGDTLVIPPMEEFAPPSAPSAPGPGAHAPSAPAAPELGGKKTHVVAQGDSLSSISLKYFGTTKHWKKIFEANKATLASPDDLVVGKSLIIPDLGRESAPAANHDGTPSPAHDGGAPSGGAPAPSHHSGLPAQLEGKGTAYTVEEGDTLEGIAEKTLGHGSEWRRIYELNKGVTMKDENHLSVGMVIAIPPKEEAPASHDRPPLPPRAPAAAKEPALSKAPPEPPKKTEAKEESKEKGRPSGATHLIGD